MKQGGRGNGAAGMPGASAANRGFPPRSPARQGAGAGPGRRQGRVPGAAVLLLSLSTPAFAACPTQSAAGTWFLLGEAQAEAPRTPGGMRYCSLSARLQLSPDGSAEVSAIRTTCQGEEPTLSTASAEWSWNEELCLGLLDSIDSYGKKQSMYFLLLEDTTRFLGLQGHKGLRMAVRWTGSRS